MIITGDALVNLRDLPDESVQCCVTSPPYWGLRDYGHEGQLGQEKTLDEFISNLVNIFREVRRVLKPDGILWLNLGDSYAGSWGNQSRPENRGKQRAITKEQFQNFEPYGDLSKKKKTGSMSRTPGLKPKDLCGVPWRVAFALQADGWWLRQDIIWSKPNGMPESVQDRCTKNHEYIFLLAKSKKYYFDYESIQEPAKRADELRFADKGGRIHTGVSYDGRGKSTRRFNGSNRVGDSNTKHGDDIETKVMARKRSVWTVTTKPFKGAHFATFPKDLILPCILSGSRVGDTVIDPFAGAGTTGLVCWEQGREFVGIEINPEYAEMARKRIEHGGGAKSG